MTGAKAYCFKMMAWVCAAGLLSATGLGSLASFGLGDGLVTKAFALEEPGATVHKIMDAKSGGWVVPDGRGGSLEYQAPKLGHYLKKIDGLVLAKENENFLFEPASAIKALYHFHVMKQIENGAVINGAPVTLNTNIPMTFTKGSCPKNENVYDMRLKDVLAWMMLKSDNNATLAVQNYFGLQNIYQTEYDLDMSQTTVVHTIGCGGPPQNTMTLVEAGKLYEGAANGFLADRETAYSLMASPSLNPAEPSVDDLEFNSITHPGVFLQFKSLRDSAAKAGSYDYGGGKYLTIAGWASLPFKDTSCNIVNSEYVFGAFIHDAYYIDSSFDIWKMPGQLLSVESKSAIQSWKRCEIDAKIVSQRIAGLNPVIGVVGQNIKIDLHSGLEADGIGLVPEAIVEGKATPLSSGIKVKVPTLQTSIYDLVDGEHHSTTHSFTLTCDTAGTKYVKIKSTVYPRSDLLPMVDLVSNNNSKERTIEVNCMTKLFLVG